MKKKGMPVVHGSEVNVTPLIDVVMCLIIFFMLVAKIGVTSGADATITIPDGYRGVRIDDMGNTITLNVRPPAGAEHNAIGADFPDVTTLVDNRLQEVPTVELDQNRKPIANRRPLLDTLKAMKTRNPEFKVIIRGEEGMQYRYLEPVLVTCAEAGAKNVNFQTKEGQVQDAPAAK